VADSRISILCMPSMLCMRNQFLQQAQPDIVSVRAANLRTCVCGCRRGQRSRCGHQGPSLSEIQARCGCGRGARNTFVDAGSGGGRRAQLAHDLAQVRFGGHPYRRRSPLSRPTRVPARAIPECTRPAAQNNSAYLLMCCTGMFWDCERQGHCHDETEVRDSRAWL
jgi:hypothetical protein